MSEVKKIKQEGENPVPECDMCTIGVSPTKISNIPVFGEKELPLIIAAIKEGK